MGWIKVAAVCVVFISPLVGAVCTLAYVVCQLYDKSDPGENEK
ncbi:hypothetical protein OU798_07615 [Prolixibacteraceae bacterium Z1-6]|uniref:Uncharacterized protein n=1 Tax=Draconibacterium aestuarii TaxID=2998507 RepID=A0A9X3F4H3_9BACT|nr:hypothetical protein [Prolixibacteraceae bacterium Z1-6]